MTGPNWDTCFAEMPELIEITRWQKIKFWLWYNLCYKWVWVYPKRNKKI